jgi:hypothetical protein
MVKDAQEAAIPGANVTAVEQDKKTSVAVLTDPEGRFIFTNLLPGRYSITFVAGGFKKTERTGVTLLANDRMSLGEIGMEVGAVSESVEVKAVAQELKTESAERSDAMTAVQLENLAVNSRSYLQLAGFLPGVVSTANLTTGGHAGLANISANGARFDQNNLTLDGLGNVDTGNNGDQLATISLDAVQEFKVLTSSYQAEYGRSSGAQISVVTKSGTSDFHGSGFWYHRHEGLNANNWKNDRDGLARNLFRFNDLGYTIGGPVFIPNHFNRDRNKLFFFWSQEYQRQLKPQNRRDMTVPTAAERKGDFSQSVDKNNNPVTIIDPTTRAPFPGNVIPQNRLYAPGLAALAFYPEPNAQGNVGFNYRTQIPDSYPRREDLIRGDYYLTGKWKFFSHYLNNYDSVTSAYGSFVLGSAFPKVPITDSRPGRSFVVSATALLSPVMTNEATWGFGKNIIHIDPVNDGLSRAKTGIDIPLIYPNAVQNDFIPRFAYAGSKIGNQGQFGTNNAPFYNYNTTIEWIDNLTRVMGSHVAKAGLYIQRSRKDQTSFANSSGDIDFGDDSSNPLDTGLGWSNMALGVYRTFNQASGYFTGKYRYTNVEWYIQDTWKVTRRLTLDYGLRFQWIQPQFDAGLQTATFLPNRYDPKQGVRLYYPTLVNGTKAAIDRLTGDLQPGTSVGKIVPNSGNILDGIAKAGVDVSKYLIKDRGIHYAPRFGLAYDLTGKQQVVLRAGAGIFYDRFQGNEVFDMLTNPPTTISPTLVNGYLRDVDAKNILLAPLGLNAFDYNGDVPTVYSENVSIQAQLPWLLVLDTAYVGSQSRHQLQRVNLNAIPYGAAFQPQNQDPTKSSGTLGSAAYDRDFLRPYPGFGDITLHQFGGTANYNSWQNTLTRRFSKGVTLSANYTWARALGTSDDRGNYNRIDDQTRVANYALLAFHRQHTFNFYYNWDLPSAFRNHRTAHALLDGWQISGATTFQTGSPYTPGISISGIGNQNLTGSYTEGYRLKLIGNPRTGTDDPYNRLNPAAFTVPPVGTRGIDAPRNYMINPGINTWAMSLQKEFAVTERYRFQLRADGFNVFNHTQFSGINSTLNFSGLVNPAMTNLYLKADGSLNNKNGFGTVSGARDPRIMQLMMKFVF